MKVKTAELEGVQLDVAVAIAIGGHVTTAQYAQVYLNGMRQLCGEVNKRHSRYVFSPSTDWKDCGELMENLSISCYQSADAATGKVLHWVGVNELYGDGKRRGWIADNPRVAICRAVVAAKIGDEVDIPDELISKGTP
ncbi:MULTISPECIES: phage protein NinX family protein [Enterobacteriaceae]|uniref:phage protein NinX family protein n=1 Tax=Enterobacteriaceae TaxID=543 RepID=UPI0025A2D781|nr:MULTISPECIES: phage protein NinX family protein [Enterobacteriaceae]